MVALNNSIRAKESISRAITRMLSSHPFYGHIACSFRKREEEHMPTMGTDMYHLFYNPDFVTSLTKTQLVAGIAHEVEHVFMKHPLRMEDVLGCMAKHTQHGVEEHDCYLPTAQLAADFAINPHLKDGGFGLIEGAVYPETQYWDDSFEGHFRRLKKSAKRVEMPASGGCAGCRPARGKDGKALSPAERAQAEADLNIKIVNAAAFAKAAGKLPAHIERLVNDLRAPKVAWFDVLRRFMCSISNDDYRMLPPNRRFIHQGLYLPSLHSETVGDVLLILDGSGSTNEIFPQFIDEFASIMLDVRPKRLHVMVWDTQCSWRREFDNFSGESTDSLAAMQREMGAGGGTVFTDCFDYFEREVGIAPQIGIVLTDMEMAGWPNDPGYPVLWIATTDVIGPFGSTVKIEA